MCFYTLIHIIIHCTSRFSPDSFTASRNKIDVTNVNQNSHVFFAVKPKQ